MTRRTVVTGHRLGWILVESIELTDSTDKCSRLHGPPRSAGFLRTPEFTLRLGVSGCPPPCGLNPDPLAESTRPVGQPWTVDGVGDPDGGRQPQLTRSPRGDKAGRGRCMLPRVLRWTVGVLALCALVPGAAGASQHDRPICVGGWECNAQSWLD